MTRRCWRALLTNMATQWIQDVPRLKRRLYPNLQARQFPCRTRRPKSILSPENIQSMRRGFISWAQTYLTMKFQILFVSSDRRKKKGKDRKFSTQRARTNSTSCRSQATPMPPCSQVAPYSRSKRCTFLPSWAALFWCLASWNKRTIWAWMRF